MTLLMAAVQAAEPSALERDFANPPPAFRSIPLWHLNGTLTKEGIIKQLKDSRDLSGFGGVAVLPVTQTEPKYLSEEYFARYKEILDACKDLGMKVSFYDDINFPSGSAGGLMAKRFPDHIESRLDKTEDNVIGPVAWERNLPTGILMGAVAMEMETLERRDITRHASDGRISWQVPTGTWKIMLFTCVRGGNFVDYLEPESIDRFFSLTYDAYYKRFPEHFGTTIFKTFFDDVGVRKNERRTWTPAFNDKFRAKHGFSPVTLYPALWHDIGPDTAAARVSLFGFRAELLAEGYPRKVHEWAAKHGILSSGHAMGQYHPQPSLMAGDAIAFYRHSDIPMIDSIHYYGHGRPGFKLTSSASHSYDRDLTAVEIYGNYKNFDRTMLYRSGMELFVRGANLFLPHGMWYDPENVRIKPLISHFDPDTGPELARYNEWVARCSLLLRHSRPVADIGVFYPVASMWAHARLDAVVDQRQVPGNLHPGLFVPPDTDLNELSDALTGELRRDFTYLHPEILEQRCVVKGPLLHLQNKNHCGNYRVIIMPAGRVIDMASLRKIRAFHEAGGKVIATTLLPRQSAAAGGDNEVVETVRAMFGLDPLKPAVTGAYHKRSNAAGGEAYFVPSLKGLGTALDDALPAPDVRFAERGPKVNPESGMLSYLHKVKDGRDIYYFANSTDSPVDTEVRLRGAMEIQLWDPHTGETRSIASQRHEREGQPFTRLRLRLDPVKSVFMIGIATP